jgi:hypothetical protein
MPLVSITRLRVRSWRFLPMLFFYALRSTRQVSRCDGITSDLSLGGCFVCTSKPLAVKSRTRVTLTRKGETVQALAMVRIVKPRIGMGVEFPDIESASSSTLSRWLEQLCRER